LAKCTNVKISKIQPQKKNRNRCSIFIDGDYKFSLTKDLVIKHNLSEGDDLTEEEIQNILLFEEKDKIRNRAFKILHYRERSVQELTRKLCDIGFDQYLVDEVIHSFIEDKTLDDKRFARAFVADYTTLKLKGNKYIIRELTKKGIDNDSIAALLKQRDEKALIIQYISKKLLHYNIRDPKDRHRVIQRLLSRGFSSDAVYDVVNKHREQFDEE
jgi:regulatory protein